MICRSILTLGQDLVHGNAERQAWKDRVESVHPAQVASILARVPRNLMSQVDRIFADELFSINRKRLLDAI